MSTHEARPQRTEIPLEFVAWTRETHEHYRSNTERGDAVFLIPRGLSDAAEQDLEAMLRFILKTRRRRRMRVAPQQPPGHFEGRGEGGDKHGDGHEPKD